jgi:hypothetical protein
MSRKILIVGAGQSGLQLAFGLQQHGYDVTIMSSKTPEEIRTGKVMSTQAMFGPALAHERAGFLTGHVTPMVRKPVARPGKGSGIVLGMADVVVRNDPVTGQGSNMASHCAAIYLQAILDHGSKPFDQDWMQHTFDVFWNRRGQPTWICPPQLRDIRLRRRHEPGPGLASRPDRRPRAAHPARIRTRARHGLGVAHQSGLALAPEARPSGNRRADRGRLAEGHVRGIL